MRTEATIRKQLTTLQILALTLWAEARNQKRDGIEAVGSAIRNRANQPGWWGRNVREVCLAPWQFSCWNPGQDTNHLKLLRMAEGLLDGQQPADLDRYLPLCFDIAKGILADLIPDRVLGCDHYYSPKGMVPRGAVPRWAKDRVTGLPAPPEIIVGDHWFYRLGLDGIPDPDPSPDLTAPNLKVRRT